MPKRRNKRGRYPNRHRKHRNRNPRRKQSKLSKVNWFTRKHPIATGVILIIASIVLFRLSFTNAFLSSSEVFIWALLLSIGLFIAGLLVLVGWWRNNILQHHVGIKFGKW